MGSDFIHPSQELQKWAVRIKLECFLVIFIFYCFVFTAAVKLFNFRLRQCRWCFYALPDGTFTASRVPGDAQLHGRASQISARKSTTGNGSLSVHSSGGSRIFLRGTPTSMMGVQTYSFGWTLHENERIWTRGARSWRPLRSATALSHYDIGQISRESRKSVGRSGLDQQTSSQQGRLCWASFPWPIYVALEGSMAPWTPGTTAEFEKSFRNVIH